MYTRCAFEKDYTLNGRARMSLNKTRESIGIEGEMPMLAGNGGPLKLRKGEAEGQQPGRPLLLVVVMIFWGICLGMTLISRPHGRWTCGGFLAGHGLLNRRPAFPVGLAAARQLPAAVSAVPAGSKGVRPAN
jgi:hypothetical protein